jgi:nicotinamidase-related amidase
MLPLPAFYQADKVGEVWKVDYQQLAVDARQWADEHGIQPAGQDEVRVNLLLIDVQNTFCLPGFELFVGGDSGMAAVEDNRRLCAFLYRNLGRITDITLTMDTHQAIQVFHALYLVDADGNHPVPFTLVSAEQVAAGEWRFNPAAAAALGVSQEKAQADLAHYVRALEEDGRYELTIWPYHAMLGGIGHAIVPAVEEAVFFHSVARYAQPRFEIKGRNPFTEHYSALGPEVTEDSAGEPLGAVNQAMVEMVGEYDLTVIAGQAKSHCVASTVSGLLAHLQRIDPALAKRVVLLEDCTSPIVTPGMDYTPMADAAYQRFAEGGMKVVRSTDPLETWYPG